jgi:hypothetical protein
MPKLQSGLPDFSWYKIPKTGKMATKYTQRLLNILNGCILFQVATKCTNIVYSRALHIIPNGDFWFENIPSGSSVCNPFAKAMFQFPSFPQPQSKRLLPLIITFSIYFLHRCLWSGSSNCSKANKSKLEFPASLNFRTG